MASSGSCCDESLGPLSATLPHLQLPLAAIGVGIDGTDVVRRAAVVGLENAMYTRKNAKLSTEMMVSVLTPYLGPALIASEAPITVTDSGLMIHREARRHWDKCVSLEVPIEITLGHRPAAHEVVVILRLMIRDDTSWLLDWRTATESLPPSLEEKLESRVRGQLRRSRNERFRNLLEGWRWGGSLVGVSLSPEEFGTLIRILLGSAAR